MLTGGDSISKSRTIRRQKGQDAGRDAGLLQQLVDDVITQDGRVRRLPQRDVSHQGGGRGQVAADGCEVEGGNGRHESL